jgi:phosphoglycerate dehydrogenase-like enzyme
MTKIAILDDYQNVAKSYGDWAALPAGAQVTFFHENMPTVDAAAEKLRDFNVVVLMRERMAMGKALIDRLPNLKLIITTGGSNRSLDKDHAKAKGITCCFTRGGDSTATTVETALALLLGHGRGLVYEDRMMRAGKYQLTIPTTIAGNTLGVVGLGRLGSRMARICKALDMKVIAWSTNLTAEKAAAQGVDYVTKDELFARADYISVHLVLSERSRGLIGAADIAKMKKTAVLINTSRGPIIDEKAMLAALREKRIGGAGLDVYDIEPLPADHELRRLDNAVLSPHLGYVSDATYREYFEDIVDNISKWMAGTPVRVLA